jgi:F0F1-type ATP synthase assembly protein I
MPLPTWESFYVIVGSSAAALTGLMFVVIALVAESRQRSTQGVSAFGTPTIVHFCLALLVAAILSAPWRALGSVSLTITLTGIGGLVYLAIVTKRARRQTAYKPVFEDWLWHMILPFVSYATFVVAGLLILRAAHAALFGIAAATLLLLFIGIHNAWDTVTWLALEQLPKSNESQPNG